jgi:hypothetical protein
VQDSLSNTFLEILHALKVIQQMRVAHASQKGAIGLDLESGGREMIDAPMLKQVKKISVLYWMLPAHLNLGSEDYSSCHGSQH